LTDSGPGLPLAVGLSAVLHLALLSWPLQFGGGRAPAQTELPALRLRLRPPESLQPELTPALQALLAHPGASLLRIPVPRGAPELPDEVLEPVTEPTSGGLDSGDSGPRYYLRSEVERLPRILEDVAAPDSVLASFLAGLPGEGRVVIELWISDQGGVDRVDAMDESLPEDAVQAILAAFRQARFSPAHKAGQAVPCRIRIELLVRDFPPEKEVEKPWSAR